MLNCRRNVEKAIFFVACGKAQNRHAVPGSCSTLPRPATVLHVQRSLRVKVR